MANEIRFDNRFGPYGFLSMFYKCPIRLDGLKYPTAEHAYQAQKERGPDPDNIRSIFATSKTPLEARETGRLVFRCSKFSDMERIAFMRKVQRAKFSVEPLHGLLLDTGEARLVSVGNDPFWSICGDGNGRNTLGRILETIRKRCERTRPSKRKPAKRRPIAFNEASKRALKAGPYRDIPFIRFLEDRDALLYLDGRFRHMSRIDPVYRYLQRFLQEPEIIKAVYAAVDEKREEGFEKFMSEVADSLPFD